MEIIDSIKHHDVAVARKALAQSAKRPAAAFVLEGARLAARGLESPLRIERVFLRHPPDGAEEGALLERARELRVPCSFVSKGVFFKLLGLGYETSARALAIAARPANEAPVNLEGDAACVLIGESIRDPRNIGVLLRNADAWDVALALFAGASADPFCRGSVRSSTGSILRVPVRTTADLPAEIEGLKQQGFRVIGSSVHAAESLWEADLTGRVALLAGSESDGLSAAVRERCDAVVAIPMSGGASSLNVTVAAGALLCERARQLAKPGRRG